MDHRLFSHSHIKFGTNHKNHIIMTIHYEIVTSLSGVSVINATFDDSDKMLSIPMDEANSDYQRYLAWLENPEAEQSTPNLS
jgi:hypothetical protein